MRVRCNTIDDFLANLQSEPEGAVYRNLIYINRTDHPVEGTREKATKFLVCISLFAIILVNPDLIDSEQYILEMNQECGIDYRNVADAEPVGTDVLEKIVKQLEEFCAKKKISLRPGVVDF